MIFGQSAVSGRFLQSVFKPQGLVEGRLADTFVSIPSPTNIISRAEKVLSTYFGGFLMGDRTDCPASNKNDRREALSIFRELWSEGNSLLHRMYSSWDELESNIEVKSETPTCAEKHAIQPCPYCGAKQKISTPLYGIFPYANCESCKRSFFVQTDFKVRKLNEEENANIPGALIQVVEDLAKKKVAVVLRIE